MTKQLQDRVAIVTGASNGIGRAIAEAFAAEGAKTVLVARRAELLDEVAAGIRSRGGEALPAPADLTREDEVTALFEKVTKAYGRLDVLVNNAGIMRGTIAQFGTYTVDEEKKTFTMKFTASTFPNWDGISQTRTIDKLTDDEFINTNPQVGAGRGSAYNLYKRAK